MTMTPAKVDPAAIEKERLRRKRQVALGYRIFAAMRWGDLGDGHITARDPEFTDCMWMLTFPVDFKNATIHDLILIGPDGKAVDSADTRRFNTPGYRIHHPIHEARPDINSVAHVHSSWGTPFAASGKLLQPISQESTIFFEDHSLFEGEEVQVLSVETGRQIAQALGDNRAVILRNHGLLATGESVASCINNFVTMDRVCEVHLKAVDPQPISAEAARAAKADLDRHPSLVGGFNFLVSRHVGDPACVD